MPYFSQIKAILGGQVKVVRHGLQRPIAVARAVGRVRVNNGPSFNDDLGLLELPVECLENRFVGVPLGSGGALSADNTVIEKGDVHAQPNKTAKGYEAMPHRQQVHLKEK